MDAFQMIKDDHSRVNELFLKIADTSDNAVRTRERLFEQIRIELQTHAQLEEKHFYPALQKHAETKKFVAHSLDEHGEVKSMLRELDGMAKDDSAFMERIQELKQSVQDHVREEEEEIMPAARKALSDDEIQELTDKMQKDKPAERRKAS